MNKPWGHCVVRKIASHERPEPWQSPDGLFQGGLAQPQKGGLQHKEMLEIPS